MKPETIDTEKDANMVVREFHDGRSVFVEWSTDYRPWSPWSPLSVFVEVVYDLSRPEFGYVARTFPAGTTWREIANFIAETKRLTPQ